MGYFIFHGKNGPILIAPPFARERELPPGCRVALAPAGVAVAAGSLVSYGLSAKSTLSFSSIGVHSLVLSVGRAMVNIEGRLIERQELPISRQDGASLEDTLCLAGTLLLLGVPPEKLSELL